MATSKSAQALPQEASRGAEPKPDFEDSDFAAPVAASAGMASAYASDQLTYTISALEAATVAVKSLKATNTSRQARSSSPKNADGMTFFKDPESAKTVLASVVGIASLALSALALYANIALK